MRDEPMEEERTSSIFARAPSENLRSQGRITKKASQKNLFAIKGNAQNQTDNALQIDAQTQTEDIWN